MCYMARKTKIYLDIDGVLLANDKVAAKHADEFIKYLTDNFNVYWLTTHVHGDTIWVKQYLTPFLKPESIKLLDKVNVTPKDWVEFKTEAIDFSEPFLWIDDDCFSEERDALIENNCPNSWIKVDLADDEDQLLSLIKRL